MKQKEFLVNFLNRLICDYDFKISHDDYFYASYCIFELSTLLPELVSKTKNPYESPFECVYDLICNEIEDSISAIQKDSYQEHLKTFQKRTQILNNVCNGINKRMNTFLKTANDKTILQFACSQFYKNVFESRIDELSNQSIADLENVFTGDDKSCMNRIFSLIWVLYFSEPNELKHLLNTVIFPKINEMFYNHKEIDLYMLPRVVHHLSELTSNCIFIGLEFIQNLKNIFYTVLIEPKLNDIKTCICKLPIQEFLLNDSKEIHFLKVLTFYQTEKANQIITDFLNESISKFLESFENEIKIVEIAEKIIILLNIQDAFLNNVYDTGGFYTQLFNNIVTNILHKIKFSSKIGGDFSIVLASIIDASLKRSNIFKSKINHSHITRLLSFVIERDFFVKAYTTNLFYRIATRSTIGINYENQILDSISSVVLEDNIQSARKILKDCQEQCDHNVSNFSFISVKESLIIKQNLYKLKKLPYEYEQKTQQMITILKQKYPKKEYTWNHYLATLDINLRIKKTISKLILSIPQLLILELIISKGKVTFKELEDYADISTTHTEIVIRPLLIAKLIKNDQKALTNSSFTLNEKFQMKKVIFADNWNPKPIKQKSLPLDRVTCIKATIIRIMKKNRMMNIKELISKTIYETSHLFPTTESIAEDCIKLLIENCYLEMSDETHVGYIE